MKRAAAMALAAAALLYAVPLRARTPEIAGDPIMKGMWIAQDDRFIFQTIDRWSVFSAGATVNKMVVDQNLMWIATDDGVIRFETGSQRSTKLTMDDGLPSQRVTTVAFDDQYVWFGTNKGLVRYRKNDRNIKVYDETNGLPDKAITYAQSIGRQVWFGTRAGIAVFSPDVDGLRAYGEKDGMASGDVAEIFNVGSDLWCRTDVGLSRFRTEQKVFNNFPLTRMNATQLRAFAVDGADIWLATDNGLFQFQGASDNIIPFPQQDALGSKMIVGVESGSSYIYITTDKEILQYSKNSLAIRRWTAAEGLLRQDGSTGTLSQSGSFTAMFADTAWMYNVNQDQWVERKIQVKEATVKKTTGRVFGQLDAEWPYNNVKLGSLKGDSDTASRYANALGGFGVGHQLEKERTLNASMYLDYGPLDVSGIRDLQYKIEYLGNQNDVVRDVRIEDKLKYRYVEEGLERQLLLQGVHAGMATPGAEPRASLTVDAGFRRGQVARDFITGPRQETYTLSQKYILPGTEKVYVDGELLNQGTDYTIVYSAGQLLFLNPEKYDDLSVITVEYEYDLVPKKTLGNLSLLSRLPASNEVGTWILAGTSVVSNDTALYNQIDGGAPKYIDRGWKNSVYATYQLGGNTIQVSIHNMDTPENAQSLYANDLPVSRIAIAGTKDAVVDMGLAGAYASEATDGRFVINVNISDRSDAALTYIKIFTLQILNRGQQAGANVGDQFKEWLVATRLAGSPTKGMEVGVRAVELEQISSTNVTDINGAPSVRPATHLSTGALDARYQAKVGEGGLLTGYTEFAGSHDSSGDRPDGLAGMGFLRISTPKLEGMLSARTNTEGWTPIGHTTPTTIGLRTWNDARMGTLKDETRLNATGYPVEWLPVTALFTRQRAWLPDGSGGIGTLQHAIGRLQLNKAGLPGTTLQIGSTELDNPNGFQTHRLQGSVQTDYDLAPVMAFTHITKFNVRALYSVAQSETDENATYSYGDRVRLVRLEGKLSPTPTESIFALYRSRELGRQTEAGGEYFRGIYHWELMSGANSRIIPGLVPELSYNIFYDDIRLAIRSTSPAEPTQPIGGMGSGDPAIVSLAPGLAWSNTGPYGASYTPPGPPPGVLRQPGINLTGSAGAALGIYPGAWWSKLSPMAIKPTIAVGNGEQTVFGMKTTYSRVYDFVSAEVWSDPRLEVQLYQRYKIEKLESPSYPTARDKEYTTAIRNRILYRPIFTSPITFQINYQRDRLWNDPMEIPQREDEWGTNTTVYSSLQWLMRWSDLLTTRSTVSGDYESNAHRYSKTGDNYSVSNDTQKYVYGEFQIRLYPLPDVSALYIYQTSGLKRWFGNGGNTKDAWELLPGAGVIWRLGDKMYLDAFVNYQRLVCDQVAPAGTAGCSPVSTLLPHLYFTMNI